MSGWDLGLLHYSLRPNEVATAAIKANQGLSIVWGNQANCQTDESMGIRGACTGGLDYYALMITDLGSPLIHIENFFCSRGWWWQWRWWGWWQWWLMLLPMQSLLIADSDHMLDHNAPHVIIPSFCTPLGPHRLTCFSFLVLDFWQHSFQLAILWISYSNNLQKCGQNAHWSAITFPLTESHSPNWRIQHSGIPIAILPVSKRFTKDSGCKLNLPFQ